MNRRINLSGLVVTLSILASGCASYRVDSNVDTGPSTTTSTPTPSAAPSATSVLLAENNLPGRNFREIGPIEVSIKKLTIFHKNPTKEQANEALIERARKLGADAVINITYKTGIGMTTWGYIDANGVAVKLQP